MEQSVRFGTSLFALACISVAILAQATVQVVAWFGIHIASLLVMVVVSNSPLVIRCGAAVFNFNEAATVGPLLDTLIDKNLLVPVSASIDHQVLREQERILSVVESCLGPNLGISDVRALLKDAGYAELSSQISQLHYKRKGVAHPHVGIADRLKAALSNICGKQEGFDACAGLPCTSSQRHVLMLDELIPPDWQDCIVHALSPQNTFLNSNSTLQAGDSCKNSIAAPRSSVEANPDEFIFELTAEDMMDRNTLESGGGHDMCKSDVETQTEGIETLWQEREEALRDGFMSLHREQMHEARDMFHASLVERDGKLDAMFDKTKVLMDQLQAKHDEDMLELKTQHATELACLHEQRSSCDLGKSCLKKVQVMEQLNTVVEILGISIGCIIAPTDAFCELLGIAAKTAMKITDVCADGTFVVEPIHTEGQDFCCTCDRTDFVVTDFLQSSG